MSDSATTITLLIKNEAVNITCGEKESLMEAMIRHGLYPSANCGGRGTCGKCRIRIIEGSLNISSQDETLLTTQELHQGIRLACQLYPQKKAIIELLSQEETDIFSVSEYRVNNRKSLREKENSRNKIDESLEPVEKNQNNIDESLEPVEKNRKDMEISLRDVDLSKQFVDKLYGVAIDLGTTTLAFSLIDLIEHRVIKTVSAVNRQRAYGADVISRMKASNDGKRIELRDTIRLELERGIQSLLKVLTLEYRNLSSIVISGNTTMVHLLLGYSCETLGVYPFQPLDIGTITVSYKELFSEPYEIPVTILPGISTFVGGDIVSGIYACGINDTEKPFLLVDLGTNGEMAIGNKDKILVASTAAGPAFEGGNLTCGVASIPGAICKVNITSGDTKIETIQGEPPIGICGTGVIELISELLANGVIDETGLLADPYFETGFPIAEFALYQKDIRELQLAKAAIRAGIEILIRQYGVSYHEIERVYLAGGFGYQLDIAKAVSIGLIPQELMDKIEPIGNSSLAGAVSFVLDPKVVDEMKRLVNVSKEIHLSNDPEFNDLYIDYMSF